jgi:hypothetical protein
MTSRSSCSPVHLSHTLLLWVAQWSLTRDILFEHQDPPTPFVGEKHAKHVLHPGGSKALPPSHWQELSQWLKSVDTVRSKSQGMILKEARKKICTDILLIINVSNTEINP